MLTVTLQLLTQPFTMKLKSFCTSSGSYATISISGISGTPSLKMPDREIYWLSLT